MKKSKTLNINEKSISLKKSLSMKVFHLETSLLNWTFDLKHLFY
jgi:hypothetical protein